MSRITVVNPRIVIHIKSNAVDMAGIIRSQPYSCSGYIYGSAKLTGLLLRCFPFPGLVRSFHDSRGNSVDPYLFFGQFQSQRFH